MTLSTLQKKLDKLGFDTVLADNTLQAARETGDKSVEVTIDSGGGAKVVKKRRLKIEREAPIVRETLEIETFRAQIKSGADFKLLEKQISRE